MKQMSRRIQYNVYVRRLIFLGWLPKKNPKHEGEFFFSFWIVASFFVEHFGIFNKSIQTRIFRQQRMSTSVSLVTTCFMRLKRTTFFFGSFVACTFRFLLHLGRQSLVPQTERTLTHILSFSFFFFCQHRRVAATQTSVQLSQPLLRSAMEDWCTR